MGSYFQKALSNMVFETACGASIRYMAERGYTTRQIVEQLDYPMSFERVSRAVTDYFLEQGILRREPPEAEERRETYTYVQEQGKFGKISYRRVLRSEEGENPPKEWKKEAAEDFLAKKKGAGREVYVPCDFGLPEGESGTQLSVLNERQQEFLSGICWEKRRMYYRLDSRMEEIIRKLWENGQYSGWVYWR